MAIVLADRTEGVIGPLGELLTLEKLPVGTRIRWVPRRKAEVVAAVTGGLLTVDDACERFGLTLEEYTSWERGVRQKGLRGLRATPCKNGRNF
jgi:hypothetical protein